MTIIPTLMLFSKDADIESIRELVKHFNDLGGQLMFGTDTGFLRDYEPEGRIPATLSVRLLHPSGPGHVNNDSIAAIWC
jgi:hypothetical protein